MRMPGALYARVFITNLTFFFLSLRDGVLIHFYIFLGAFCVALVLYFNFTFYFYNQKNKLCSH